MAQFTIWIIRNADGLLALMLAVVIVILELVSNDSDSFPIFTPLILGILATAILHDRVQRGSVEREVRDTLLGTSSAFEELSQRLDRLPELENVLIDTRMMLDEMSMVRLLNGSQVGQALADARRNTDQWIFKGGTGTYIRAVTLPECVEHARRRRRTLFVRLEIIDPTNETVCDHYARFRRSLSDRPDGTGEIWTLDRTRKESFATILAACWHRQRFGLLDIVVGLSSTMTTFRWDLSSRCVVVTQEDPLAPAMMAEHGKFYYDRWSAELRASLEQARRVPLEQAMAVPLSDEPTVEEVRRLFASLDIPLPRTFTDQAVSDIIRKTIQAKNPYES